MAKQGTLAQHLSKVTNPQNWKKEFKNQVLELLGGIAELYMIDKALETIIGDGKKLNDFQDPQIRERMKTVIAGGLTPNKQNQSTNKKPIAPIIWELFNIQLYPHKGNTLLNQNIEDLIEYLKIHGIENITIRKEKERSNWFGSSSGFYWIIDPLTKFLKIIDELPSHGSVRVLIDEVTGFDNHTKLDEQQALSIIKRYIPLPGQKAASLEKLLNNIMRAFWNLAPGINPYITFALSVDTVIAHDLLNLVNGNQVNFIELVKILDYVALEDRRSKGRIDYNMFDRARKADIAGILKEIFSAQSHALQYTLLYMVIFKERYANPGIFDYEMGWVHGFCCYAYSIGCYEYLKIEGIAYMLEELIYGSNKLRDYTCTYMLSEIGRVLQNALGTHGSTGMVTKHVKDILKEIMLESSVKLLEGLSLKAYNEYWSKVYDIRNAGALYSPAFTIHPRISRFNDNLESAILKLNIIPYFCKLPEDLKGLAKDSDSSD